MTAFLSIASAILKGFLRDRQAVFFSIFFPLMFLVLFGGVFSGQGQSKIDLVEVGKVSLIDSLPKGAQTAFRDAFSVTKSADLNSALQQVRNGDTSLAVQQQGNRIIVRYSDADKVRSATAQGTLQAFVQSANLAASGRPPTYTYAAQRVEDRSLKTIQFITPGRSGGRSRRARRSVRPPPSPAGGAPSCCAGCGWLRCRRGWWSEPGSE